MSASAAPTAPAAPTARWRTPARLAPWSAAFFAAGFTALAAGGAPADARVLSLVVTGAALFAAMLLALSGTVALSENLARRAWGGGFRALPPAERTRAPTLKRAARYASFLWLCNGAAFWFAAAASWL